MGIKEFRYYFYFKEFTSIQYTTYFQKKVLSQGLAKLIKEMLKLEEEFDHLKPTFFHNLIQKKFSPELQHDAHEFLIYLLS